MCLPFLHFWSKWTDWQLLELLRDKDKAVCLRYIAQRRECEKCGKLQIRRVQI